MANHAAQPGSRSTRLGLVSVLVLVALLAGGFVLGSAIGSSSEPALTPTAAPVTGQESGSALVSPPYLVEDFTLISQTGEPLSLSDLRGRPVLMFFGYTHCPDVCPTTLATYRVARQLLGENADDAAFVFVSVDGERDTPDVIAQYLGQFDPSFIGLTGDAETLRQLGAQFGLLFEQVAGVVEPESEQHSEAEPGHDEGLDVDHYFVNHTSPSFLIDRDGYLRRLYFYGASARAIASGIGEALQ